MDAIGKDAIVADDAVATDSKSMDVSDGDEPLNTIKGTIKDVISAPTSS
jgi:hypothetical protein